MRDVVAEARPDLLELAVELVGDDPFELVGEGTRFAQPAIYCASIAHWERAGRPEADCVAGHSLGELAALVAAGALDPEDGLRIAVVRGALMQRAAEADGESGMMALLGDGEVARRLAEQHGLTPANDNSPDQLVVAGHDDALSAARREARKAGLRAVRLPIRGAFHSPAMQPVVGEFRAELDRVEFRPPRVATYSCITAAEFTDPREELASALVRPVRWRDTMQALYRRGIERFVETGPGKVLTGLVERNPAPDNLKPEVAHA
jgi:malonyl CoA-acyl carrier protein transacylase